MKNYLYLICGVTLVSCTALTDPTQTTMVSPYPPPAVSSVEVNGGGGVISVRSWLSSPDFVGYVIYTNDNPSALLQIQGDDINAYPSVTNKSNWAAHIGFTPVPTGGQTGSATLTGLQPGKRYFAVVTCLGSNSLLASLRTNRGLLESSPSPVFEIAPRPESTFSITNYYFTNAGSGLLFSGASVVMDSPSPTWSAVASTFVATVESFTGGFYPAISAGTASGATLRALGGAAIWGPSTPIPSSGWGAPGLPQPIAASNILLAKTATAYVKIFVETISKTPALSADLVVISGRVAWQTNLNVSGL